LWIGRGRRGGAGGLVHAQEKRVLRSGEDAQLLRERALEAVLTAVSGRDQPRDGADCVARRRQ
jgi:hypothetical protein